MKERVKAEYRSSIRSKELIKNAYFEMLQKKPQEKITVTDIVNTAKINRGTFYAHYSDINELSKSLEREFCEELYHALKKLEIFGKVTSPLETLLEISRFLEKDEERYRTLARLKKADRLITMLQKLFTEYMENNSKISESIRNSAEFKIRARFFASGVASSYIAYFNGELDVTLTELAEILNAMILESSLLFSNIS